MNRYEENFFGFYLKSKEFFEYNTFYELDLNVLICFFTHDEFEREREVVLIEFVCFVMRNELGF